VSDSDYYDDSDSESADDAYANNDTYMEDMELSNNTSVDPHRWRLNIDNFFFPTEAVSLIQMSRPKI
jgi:hypothetical protein